MVELSGLCLFFMGYSVGTERSSSGSASLSRHRLRGAVRASVSSRPELFAPPPVCLQQRNDVLSASLVFLE